jgi:hypothetical protein
MPSEMDYEALTAGRSLPPSPLHRCGPAARFFADAPLTHVRTRSSASQCSVLPIFSSRSSSPSPLQIATPSFSRPSIQVPTRASSLPPSVSEMVSIQLNHSGLCAHARTIWGLLGTVSRSLLPLQTCRAYGLPFTVSLVSRANAKLAERLPAPGLGDACELLVVYLFELDPCLQTRRCPQCV